jgi:signal transduction histidine kinase
MRFNLKTPLNWTLATAREAIAQVPNAYWKHELELASKKYHKIAAWFAIILDPIFAISDYFNIPDSWKEVFVLRISVALITLITLFLRKHFNLPSYYIVIVPFLLISLQNAYTYRLIDNEDLVGHNFNYMALIIGAAMFVLWHWTYSVIVIILSVFVTWFCVSQNQNIAFEEFFVKGGLLLCAVSAFMLVLIKTRYDLTVKEIKARLALQMSKEEIQAQNEELQSQEEVIRGINENLENIVHVRTLELEKKNKALEEYAFINAHKLRSPVASILGLINLLKKVDLNKDAKDMMYHLEDSADKLDAIVNSITKAIEKGDK